MSRRPWRDIQFQGQACSGVVRQSAAWGKNKKCRPCLYFLRLFEYDSGSFDRLFCLPKILIWFKCNKMLWTALFHESLTVTILFRESFSNPSLWPSGIGSRLWRIRLSSIPDSVGYISHVHWPYDYLGSFGVLWVHMAWHKNCVFWAENPTFRVAISNQ